MGVCLPTGGPTLHGPPLTQVAGHRARGREAIERPGPAQCGGIRAAQQVGYGVGELDSVQCSPSSGGREAGEEPGLAGVGAVPSRQAQGTWRCVLQEASAEGGAARLPDVQKGGWSFVPLHVEAQQVQQLTPGQ